MKNIHLSLGLLACLSAIEIAAAEPLGERGGQELICSLQSGLWSSPSTWEGGKVPGVLARVQVREGHAVTYDISSEQIVRSIHVAGILTFARGCNTRLNVGLIKIQPGVDASEDGFNCEAHVTEIEPGKARPAMEVGTPEQPIPPGYSATIRLVAVEGMNRETCPAIVCCGGRMDFHGAPLNRTWVKLGATANAHLANEPGTVAAEGDRELCLAESVTGWRVGDRIVVTTTGSRERINTRITLRAGGSKEPSDRRGAGPRDKSLAKFTAFTEERIIKAIHDNRRLTLDSPLTFKHIGDGDYHGEVANLSRNVVVESADPAKGRGHTMYHRFSKGSISYAEFRHLGKEGVLGKYPIHIHLAGDTMRGSYVLGASVWDSGNRWITVHGTSYFIVRDCVGYQSVGHGFYLEDGSEVFNVFDRNLAVQAFEGKPLPDQFLPFDHNDGAGFWGANGRNIFTRNVAVECDGWGFLFQATPSRKFDVRRPVLQSDGSVERMDVRKLPFVRFDGNEVHDQGVGIEFGDGALSPDAGHPFLIQNTKIWNTHWAFTPRSRYALDNMEIVDCVYGVFNSAYDAELFSLGSSGLTFTRTRIPITMPSSRAISSFEGPTDYRDTLPPATVITRAVKSPSGALTVEGTSSDDQTVQKVLVNGQEAKATRANFAEWKISLEESWNNEVKLTAHAVDDSGNSELNPHVLLIRLPSK